MSKPTAALRSRRSLRASLRAPELGRRVLPRELTAWYVVALFRLALAVVVVLRLIGVEEGEQRAEQPPRAYEQAAKRIEFRPGW